MKAETKAVHLVDYLGLTTVGEKVECSANWLADKMVVRRVGTKVSSSVERKAGRLVGLMEIELVQ